VTTPDRSARVAALLSRVAMGDQGAFADFYELTSSHLYGVAVRILKDAAAAEEILQEAYVNVWHHAGSYEVAKSQPMTWLTSIVRNRCLDQLRRREVDTVTLTSDDDDAPEYDVPDDDMTPAEMLLAGAEARSVRDCVDALDAAPKQAIALAFYQGLSHSELATHMRQPLGTVKSWVRRGLERLKDCLDRAGMVPESLDEVLRRDRPAALYFQAGPQIPTGQVTSLSRMRALANVIDRHGITVIEDTTLAALAFDGTASMLADHCRVATVVSTGSLSKTCFAGIRLGWIRGPLQVIDQTIYRHLGFDLGASVLSQILALQLLPHLDEIAPERRRRLHDAVDAAFDQLASVIPEAAIVRPEGGSILWAEFPVEDSASLVDVARRHGVRVAMGSIHIADKKPGPFVRIDVDRPARLVREGIDRLGRAWHDVRNAFGQ